MFRVLRPGGLVSLGAHGPEHYWEAIDTTLRVINKKYVLGYRLEFWPQTEKQIHIRRFSVCGQNFTFTVNEKDNLSRNIEPGQLQCFILIGYSSVFFNFSLL